MRPYLELAAAGFRRYSTYRAAVLAGAFTNTVFGFIRISILIAAIGVAGGTLVGYDRDSASTYVWLGQALIAPVAVFGWTEVADRIKTGEIAVDFARPVDVLGAYWAADLGRAALQLLTRGTLPLLIGAMTIGIAFPKSWTAYPLGALSLLLGISVSFLLRFGLNLIGFWALDIRGFVGLYIVVIGPFSGLYIPIDLLPTVLRTAAYWLPFSSMFQFPIDVLSGRVLGLDALRRVGHQAAWLLGLLIMCRLVMRRAVRRLVVQGG